MKTLQEILEFGKAHKACKSEYKKFKFFIETGDELQAWQTVLGNIVWLKQERLEIELSDVLQITNIAKTWHDNGQLKERCTYNAGKLDGLYESWYDNGQLYDRYTYGTEGKLDGLYESWHSNGQLDIRCTYKNGVRDGLCERWWYSGQLWQRCTYNEGKPDGLYEFWDETGQVEERLLFKNGELVKEPK